VTGVQTCALPIYHITLPADVADKVLPAEQYAKARPINVDAWAGSAKTLGKMWQEKVAPKL
jgi:putative spermidine/putrescine transport system substrate-binding protein